MWYLSESVDNLDLINRMYAWTQASVHTEDFIVYNAAQGQVVEHVCEVMPNIRSAVLP